MGVPIHGIDNFNCSRVPQPSCAGFQDDINLNLFGALQGFGHVFPFLDQRGMAGFVLLEFL